MKFLKTISIVSFSIFLTFFGLVYKSKQIIPVQAEGPIEIYYLQDLDEIRNGLAESYVLMNDLDFNSDSSYDQTDPDWQTKKTTWTTGSGWNPMGTSSTVFFGGNFDGGEHTISNLYINKGTTNYIGLFGSNKGTVENILLEDVDVRGNQFVSALIGYNYSNGIIRNSSTSGNIIGNKDVGGLTGRNDGLIDFSSSFSNIQQFDYNVGGLAGVHGGTIKDSFFSGTITTDNWGDVGGLAGDIWSGKFINSYYNIDEVLIDGFPRISAGGIYSDDFNQWLNNNRSLDVNNYLTSVNSYYQINNLNDFKKLLIFGQDPTLKFKLNANLDLINEIGFYIPYLAGELDGNGYEIFNFSFTANKISTIGLVGKLSEDGIVSNLGVKNLEILSYYLSTGGLIGINEGIVVNSYSTGAISNITDATEYTGGLVGVNRGRIENSYSSVSVQGGAYVGGLVSRNFGTIIDSYATGNVHGPYNLGGLVGENREVIENSWAKGKIFDIYNWNYLVGGLVGSNSGTVTNSFWDIDTSERSVSAGGTGKTTLQMLNILTYNNVSEGLDTPWAISLKSNFNPSSEDEWYIEDSLDYPRLAFQYDSPRVLTVSSTNVKQNVATLTGNLTYIDDEDSLQVYFQYKTASGEWVDTSEITKTTTGVFSQDIQGLIPNTPYSFRTVVSWRDTGTIYGDTLTFTTQALPSLFNGIESNILQIVNLEDTEKELIFTRSNIGNIAFPPGLNLLDNIEQLLLLDDYLIIAYDSTKNVFRTKINSTGQPYLSSKPAVVQFYNVSTKLGIQGLTSNKLKDLLIISVYDDSGTLVIDTSNYFNWDNVTYDSNTDTLTLTVNHFSEYVLGIKEQLPQTGMSILPSILSGMLILVGFTLVLPKKKVRNHNSSVYQTN